MEINEHYDVVVVGGGPAGINAAIAAGRKNMKTLLIERYGFLGGMSTAALVYPWMTFHTNNGKQVIKGIAQEIVSRLQERGGSPGHIRDTIGFVYSVTPYHPEKYIVLAIEMLKEAGVELLLHSFVDNVCVEDDQITSVTVTGKSGRIHIAGEIFIDATGDGDVSHLAGVPMFKGREKDHKMQPMTMKFRMRGVNTTKITQYMIDHPSHFYKKSLIDELKAGKVSLSGVQGFYPQWEKAKLPINRDQVLFFIGPAEDEVLVNCTRVQGYDGTNVHDLSNAEYEGRKQVLMVADFLTQHVPGFEHAAVTTVGTQIGIRETRRIIGHYVLDKEDVVQGRKFDDVIARSGYPIDIHDPTKRGVEFAFVKGDGAFDIPYRCLIPKNVNNLLAAGRCISTTHEAFATTRLTPSAMATGQAAGTAASLAVEKNVSPASVEVQDLQDELKANGAVLE
ncbi:FAD-dependent oxidoreductase [Novibacillus thermophilus]|uniref:FAD-dependent oxidoreductase n=1 Tax=Novibacillus thermophilus TaxID=1471761 RepID=A0A1U9K6Y4_9BACL|nr:FAD-dependent oxidoreductase [Novibacillus thermophilus]AQS55773.1 FAD-dependent oxidoreductase [Novibacillus thermophilus]